MHDNVPIGDEKSYWIEGTTRRWDGYLHFQREPQQMLDWFARFMRRAGRDAPRSSTSSGAPGSSRRARGGE